MGNERRCVVTGLGLICALGDDTEKCWSAAVGGVTVIREVQSVSTEGCYANKGAEVAVSSERLSGEDYDRSSLLCIKAAGEALADAGVKYGLPRDVAYLLASQTLAGTGRMQIETGMHPGAIKDGVCSPAGTTIRGVEALERAGLRAAMLDAVQAVMEKKA